MLPNRNEPNNDEIDLVELWSRFKPICAKYWYWMLLAPVVSVSLGLGLSKIPNAQWEAVAIMRIGRTSRTELVEKADDIISRFATVGFKDQVLSVCGLPLSMAEKNLYRGSLSAHQLKAPDMIELKVRGLSRESAAKLASVTVESVKESHVAAISLATTNFKKRLVDTERKQQRNDAIIAEFGNTSTADGALAELVALYLSEGLGNNISAARDDLKAVSPTVMVGVTVGDLPVYPKTNDWIALAGCLGLFLGVVISLVLNARALPKAHN